MTTQAEEKTNVGNYFVSNYPPFSFWRAENLPDVQRVLYEAPGPDTPLGLYLHIPFCRKRCKFCYFRVYTDRSAKEVESYLDALGREVELYADLPVIGSRKLQFVYFGGGTPSYLSVRQLQKLTTRLKAAMTWDAAEEVTFECEPGTLTEPKLAAIRDLGVTRLSLGVENFDDTVLEENGRAHRSPEIFRAYEAARNLGFPQINIDLIAGMVGETDANWQRCITQALEMEPDSLTVYQMELPFNTVYSREILGGNIASPVADWDTKRRWVDEAFAAFEAAGYDVSSAYTVVKDRARTSFVYRDSVWHGADMIGTGVASFSHVGGVHYQNLDEWPPYSAAIEKGELPLARGLAPTPRQLLIRELILQLKLGRVGGEYFRRKFGVDIFDEFADVWSAMQDEGAAVLTDHSEVRLTRPGLLRADSLLPPFFEPEHRTTRYT
jgi:oxygen-independent coproporphyrinogen-3 oxidase